MSTLKWTEFELFSIHSQHFFGKTYMTCFSCRAARELLRCTGLAKAGPSPLPRGSGTSSPFRSPLYEFDGLWFSFTEPEEKHTTSCAQHAFKRNGTVWNTNSRCFLSASIGLSGRICRAGWEKGCTTSHVMRNSPPHTRVKQIFLTQTFPADHRNSTDHVSRNLLGSRS